MKCSRARIPTKGLIYKDFSSEMPAKHGGFVRNKIDGSQCISRDSRLLQAARQLGKNLIFALKRMQVIIGELPACNLCPPQIHPPKARAGHMGHDYREGIVQCPAGSA